VAGKPLCLRFLTSAVLYWKWHPIRWASIDQPLFQDNLGKPAPEILNQLKRDDMVAVASAGPYANHLHLAPDR